MSREARDIARRAIGEKAILDAAKELHDQTRAELAGELEAGDRVTIKADGTPLGMVYVTDPKGTLRIVDDEAFLAWVQANHPTAIIPAVNPAWQRALLAAGADSNGEVPDGCEVVVGRPTLVVKPSDAAKAIALGLVQRELES